ncbi:ergothioneine biosynthesis protein EgtC [Phormidesmis sp. 146-35]
MCRLFGYLGSPVQLDRLLTQPEHSLIVQSYQPREMTAGTMNADGYGLGWYHPQRDTEPFLYKNILPIWNDINLPSLSRYIESGCILANVRSATAGLAVDLSNCQPFQHSLILAMHNGFIKNFRQTLYRPIRDRLSDLAYQLIKGNTDSEHLFALLIDELQTTDSLAQALNQTIKLVAQLADKQETPFSANLMVSDGQQLVVSRYADRLKVPTLYWLRDHPSFPQSVMVASEPIFPGNWHPLPDRCVAILKHDHDPEICPL